MPKTDALHLRPVFKDRIWGGTTLKKLYGSIVPDGAVGEAWLVSAVPGSASVVTEGVYAGSTLAELYAENRALFPDAAGPFPLLTKIIHAADRLSVQVHPADAYALVHENQLGKSECWYVMDAEPGAELVVGHRATTRAQLARAVADGTFETYLTTVPVRRGDFVYIPAGTLHAIGKGILILETQQTSDVTYRFYDYRRRDALGNPRPLHLEQALAVVDVPAKTAEIVNFDDVEGLAVMIETPHFTVMKLHVDAAFHYLPSQRRWYVATVVAGSGTFNGRAIRTGDAFVVPATVGEIDIRGACDLVLSFVDPEARP